MTRQPARSSGLRMMPDQPKVCAICGERILSKQGAEFFYDLTPAKAHRSTHNDCRKRTS